MTIGRIIHTAHVIIAIVMAWEYRHEFLDLLYRRYATLSASNVSIITSWLIIATLAVIIATTQAVKEEHQWSTNN